MWCCLSCVGELFMYLKTRSSVIEAAVCSVYVGFRYKKEKLETLYITLPVVQVTVHPIEGIAVEWKYDERAVLTLC